MYHRILDPIVNSNPYETEQVDECNLVPVVTDSNLPSFATHRKGVSKIKLDSISDLSLIGSYPVTIISEITFWSDYTKSSETVLTASHTFTIYIEPCTINSYFDSITVGTLTYFIGDPTYTDGPYAFQQDLACNYPETITVTNLPTLATHNTGSADFTVPSTTDLSLIGVYTVTIRGEIQVPTDYTKTVYDTIFVEYPFELRIEPCLINSFFSSPTAADMFYTVG